jgi:hypothetical protein
MAELLGNAWDEDAEDAAENEDTDDLSEDPTLEIKPAVSAPPDEEAAVPEETPTQEVPAAPAAVAPVAVSSVVSQAAEVISQSRAQGATTTSPIQATPEPEAPRVEAPAPSGPGSTPREPGTTWAGNRPPADRLEGLTMAQRMQLGLTGERDARLAILKDPNRSLHIYVLRNPQIGLDEVQFAAKQPHLSPDAFRIIADHREWGSNVQVCINIARNPNSPIQLAIKMLEKIPITELRAIARGNGRAPLVAAARKRLLE